MTFFYKTKKRRISKVKPKLVNEPKTHKEKRLELAKALNLKLISIHLFGRLDVCIDIYKRLRLQSCFCFLCIRRM